MDQQSQQSLKSIRSKLIELLEVGSEILKLISCAMLMADTYEWKWKCYENYEPTNQRTMNQVNK